MIVRAANGLADAVILCRAINIIVGGLNTCEMNMRERYEFIVKGAKPGLMKKRPSFGTFQRIFRVPTF
jgi:hypothetical protein